MPESLGPVHVLTCIRNAYPGGVVPGGDYPALLALLRRYLPVDDVVGVATELVVRGVTAFTGADLRGAITETLTANVPLADVQRVIEQLRTGGWNIAETFNPGAA